MGFFDRISNVFRKKSDLNRLKALESDLKREIEEKPVPSESDGETQQLTIDRKSVQLGMAAGYTGSSIRNIESSLTRIESQMVSKDWLAVKLEEERKLGRQVLDGLSQRLEFIEQMLRQGPAKSVYEEKLSSKMAEVISVVKEHKEMSYEELAGKLNLQVSTLRGLLSNILKRNDMIERFLVENRGWVRYVGGDSSDLNRQIFYDFSGERALSFPFERLVRVLGYAILEKNVQKAPDYILEKDGRKIAAELKVAANTTTVQTGIGQLLVAKNSRPLDELWLVFPDVDVPAHLVQTTKSVGVKIYTVKEDRLAEAV